MIEIEFIIGDLRDVLPQLDGHFDRVFHDPFSPDRMPTLWSVDLFRHYHRLLRPNEGLLLTYSAAGAVRGGLLEAGFSIAKTSGIGRKNGGTVAWIPSERNSSPDGDLPSSTFQRLRAWELDYLNSQAGLPFRDPNLDLTVDAIQQHRLEEQKASGRISGSIVRKQRMADTQKPFDH